MFPRLVHEITHEKQVASKRFLVRSVELELDKEKCRNCGICLTACPNDVIKRGAAGATVKKTYSDENVTGVVLDPEKCSYCGVCTYFCPFDALRLKIDGEVVPPDHIQLVEQGALPSLTGETVVLEDGKTGKKHFEGHLEYDKETCRSGCETCINICPTSTLKFTRAEPWSKRTMHIDRDKCIYCGACAYSCPTGSIKVFRDKIFHEGKFLEPFWPRIEKKLLEFHSAYP